MRKIFILGLLLAASFAPRAAHAYPQWQFSSGTSRCNQCHFAPAGGSLITNYARDAVGEDLSSFQGNGGFAWGALGELPGWLALGFDGRYAVLQHDAGNPEGAMFAHFPMQADAYARVAFADSFSLMASVGYRGSARNSPAGLGNDNFYPATADRFISREHYLMWRSGAIGPYVRVGRFFAPYGLRLAEHTAYVRRDNGFNLLYETYGLSGGIVENAWELHVTAFLPDLVRHFGGQDKGVAAMFEYRLADAYALGLDFKFGLGDSSAKRVGGGGFAKAYVAPIKTILMAQVDVYNLQGASGSASNQLIGYFGPTVFPVRGLWLGAYAEISQTDIQVKGTATQAINGQLNWFPYPHLELVIQARMQSPQQQEAAKTFMAQLHMFL
jgi:hypothetical protein